jgi:hypothetical protein
MTPSLILKLPLPESMGGPRRASPATAPAEPPSQHRPVRSTRTQVTTYNNAILAGTAHHTPTKYLEKHHKNVLHGPIVVMEKGRKAGKDGNEGVSGRMGMGPALGEGGTPTGTVPLYEKAGPGRARKSPNTAASGGMLKESALREGSIPRGTPPISLPKNAGCARTGPNTAANRGAGTLSAHRQSTTPISEHAGRGKIRGPHGAYVKKTQDVLNAVVAASPEPSTASTPARPATATAPAYSKLPLTEYWDEDTWRRFTKTAVVTLSTVVQGLGLRPSSGRMRTFQHSAAQNLSNDIGAIAMKLYAQLPASDLVSCAADAKYLDEELDVTLDTYAPDVWGMDADRGQLLAPEEGSVYKEDLVYEIDEDRKVLWLGLHRWVFVRAFELLRKHGGEEDARMGVLEALGGAGDAGPVEKKLELGVGTKRKAPVQEDVVKKRVLAPPGGSGKYFMDKAEPRLVSQVPWKSALRPPVRPLDSLTTVFLDYVDNFGKPSSQEAAVLNAIERAYYQLSESLPVMLGDLKEADLFPHTLAAWLTYRRTILDVRESHALTPFLDLSPVTIKIKNSRLLTELRKARDDFIRHGGTGEAIEDHAENVLEWCFDRLHKFAYGPHRQSIQWKNIEFWRLEDELEILANDLVRGGGEWVIMGPSDCPIRLVKEEK